MSGTNTVLNNALSFDNKTELGSNTVKAIYTIGYNALTGNAYSSALNARPTFDVATWKALNDGKGISFDIKISDTDTDDQLDSSTPPVEKPQEYWWNTTSNDGYAMTYYSGFLGVASGSSISSVNGDAVSIFGNITADQISLTKEANVEIYNVIGQCILKLDDVSSVNLKSLKSGLYIIKANNQTLKFYHK